MKPIKFTMRPSIKTIINLTVLVIFTIVYLSSFLPLTKVIIYLAAFTVFFINISNEIKIDFISSDEKKEILSNMSIVFGASLVGMGVAALTEILGAKIELSLSIPLIIILLETIAMMTVGGVFLSFFIYGVLKRIFNIEIVE